MTPLERAKAFVQSRAAKTALKIAPLALATVVSVNQKAQAITTPPQFSGGAPVWTAPVGTGSFLELTDSTSSSAPYGTGGIKGWGSTDSQQAGGNGTSDVSFEMSGTGSGTFVNDTVTLSWDFTGTCDKDCKANEDTGADAFQYRVQACVESQCTSTDWTPFFADPTGSTVISGLAGSGFSSWSASIDFEWQGQGLETATFNVNSLALDPGPINVPTVPEPASALLALAGLPFLKRVIRKK